MPRVLDDLQSYSTEHPTDKQFLVRTVDAFEYVSDDVADVQLLTRAMNRMLLNPRVASALCALCTGYEDSLFNKDDAATTMFNKQIKQTGKLARDDNQRPQLRHHLTTDAHVDPEMEELKRIGGLTRDQCQTENQRWKQYKCAPRKELNSNVCGLNTNFGCEKGVRNAPSNCVLQANNLCGLSDVGRRNKERISGRRHVRNLTMDARDQYNAQ
jgi:hypothetical protein